MVTLKLEVLFQNCSGTSSYRILLKCSNPVDTLEWISSSEHSCNVLVPAFMFTLQAHWFHCAQGQTSIYTSNMYQNLLPNSGITNYCRWCWELFIPAFPWLAGIPFPNKKERLWNCAHSKSMNQESFYRLELIKYAHWYIYIFLRLFYFRIIDGHCA